MAEPSNCSSTAIELRDEAGAVVEANEVGEVFTRSPYFFNGYLNNPAETAATFRDGWISVGDLARRDDEGYLNIYPREIEELLCTHPRVEEAAVIGVPDPQWGESLKREREDTEAGTEGPQVGGARNRR